MLATQPEFLNSLLETGAKCSWVNRVPEADVKHDRQIALDNLRIHHELAVEQHGGSIEQFYRCEQTHSNLVSAITGNEASMIVPCVDGLITNKTGLTLGIYVADCGAIYLSDKKRPAVGIVHSGKVGTEKNIMRATVEAFKKEFGSQPEDLVVALAPCIRPPAYEVDFASDIKRQAIEVGVLEQNFHDSGVCTTSDNERYYSYRKEQGQTGRMLALVSL